MKYSDYAACAPAVILTSWFLIQPTFLGAANYLFVFFFGFCGITIVYALFALAYGLISSHPVPDFRWRRYCALAVVNAVPFAVAGFVYAQRSSSG